MLKRWLLYLLFFSALALALLVIFAPLVPLDRFAAQIEEALEQQTGLPIELEGEVRLQVLPNIHLSAAQVRIPQPENFALPNGAPVDFLRVESLETKVGLQALWQGRIDIESIRIKEPRLNLVRAFNGALNLDAFERPEAQVPQTATGGAAATTAQNEDAKPALALSLISIEQGQLLFQDYADGDQNQTTRAPLNYSLDQVTASLNSGSSTDPDTITFAFQFRQEAIEGQVQLTSLQDLLTSKPSKLLLTLNSRMGSAELKTNLNLADTSLMTAEVQLRNLKPDLLSSVFITEPLPKQIGTLAHGDLNGKLNLTFANKQLDASFDTLTYNLDYAEVRLNGTLAQIGDQYALFGRLEARSNDLDSMLNRDASLNQEWISPDLASALGQIQRQSLWFSTDLSWLDDQLSLSGIDVSLQLDEASLSTQGHLSVLEPSQALDSTQGELHFALDLPSSAKAKWANLLDANFSSLLRDLHREVSGLSASGSLLAKGSTFALKDMAIDLTGQTADLAFTGTVELEKNQGVSGENQSFTLGKIDGSAELSVPRTDRLFSVLREHVPAVRNVFLDTNAYSGPSHLSGKIQSTGQEASQGVRVETLIFTHQSPSIDVEFLGSLDLPSFDAPFPLETLAATGAFSLKAPSLRQIAANFKLQLPGQPEVFQQVDFSSSLNLNQGTLSLRDARLTLDALKTAFNLDYPLNASKPSIALGLNASRLDLDTYLSNSQESSTISGQGTARQSAGGWSHTPFDLSGLQVLNLNVQANIQNLRYATYDLGQTELSLTLQDGLLNLDLSRASIFAGQAHSQIMVDARQSDPQISLTGRLDQVQAQAFLQQVLRVDRVSGLGSLDLDVRARGQSEAALISSLNGLARAQIDEGALLGFDLRQIIENARRGILTVVKSPDHKTEFTRAKLYFQISQGIAQVQGLDFWSPVLRTGASGYFDLPNRLMNLRMPLEIGVFRRDGVRETPSLRVPVTVQGTWLDPTIRIDQNALLAEFAKNPSAYLDLLPQSMELGNFIKDQVKAKSLVQGLSNTVTGAATSEVKQAVTDVQSQVNQQVQGIINQVGQQNIDQTTQQIDQQLGTNLGREVNRVIQDLGDHQKTEQAIEDGVNKLLDKLF